MRGEPTQSPRELAETPLPRRSKHTKPKAKPAAHQLLLLLSLPSFLVFPLPRPAQPSHGAAHLQDDYGLPPDPPALQIYTPPHALHRRALHPVARAPAPPYRCRGRRLRLRLLLAAAACRGRRGGWASLEEDSAPPQGEFRYSLPLKSPPIHYPTAPQWPIRFSMCLSWPKKTKMKSQQLFLPFKP